MNEIKVDMKIGRKVFFSCFYNFLKDVLNLKWLLNIFFFKENINN